MPRIVVIGGGISGLATAHYLVAEAPDFDVTLLESQKRLGGTLGSESVDGFLFERGANGFLDNVPDTLELARDLGLGERTEPSSPAACNRYIYKNQRLHAVPTSPFALMRSPLLSLRGRVRVLLESFQPRGDSEDSVASFGRRRIGEEAMRTFLDPLVTGIHAGDVERLSLQSAFPRIARMEERYGSLIRAMAQERRERKQAAEDPDAAAADSAQPTSPDRQQLYSFPRGMQELVDAAAEHLGERVRLGTKVTEVRREKESVRVRAADGSSEVADAVVLALPSYIAASLFASGDPLTARAFESIPYAPIAVACLGFRREAVGHALDGYGFLVPRDQGLRILGCIFVSTLFPEHAPEGTVNLRCLLGGARDPDILNSSDENLLDIVREELRPILGLQGMPDPVRIFRYGRGIPQYNLGHSDRIDRLERRLWDLPGVFIAGNAYHGIGLNDCVRMGKRKARAMREYLRR